MIFCAGTFDNRGEALKPMLEIVPEFHGNDACRPIIVMREGNAPNPSTKEREI
jgi:hypothetical protein